MQCQVCGALSNLVVAEEAAARAMEGGVVGMLAAAVRALHPGGELEGGSEVEISAEGRLEIAISTASVVRQLLTNEANAAGCAEGGAAPLLVALLEAHGTESAELTRLVVTATTLPGCAPGARACVRARRPPSCRATAMQTPPVTATCHVAAVWPARCGRRPAAAATARPLRRWAHCGS